MIILGIDPGLLHMGWGIIEKKNRRDIKPLHFGTVSPPSQAVLEQRFLFLATALEDIIKKYTPDAVAIETVFLNQANERGVLNTFKLGQVYGIIILTCAKFKIPVTSYAPAAIKKGIIGSGRADKEQILFAVSASLSLGKTDLRTTHEADALAVALFHTYQLKEPS